MNLPLGIDNILVGLREQEIEEVILDWKIYRNGYNIYYAIDTSDIVSYFLPYTELDRMISEKRKWSQQTIAYESFFNSENTENLIIMNEYRSELLSIKNDLGTKIRRFGEIKAYINNFFLSEYVNPSSKNLLVLEKDFELLVSFLVLLEKNELKDGIYNEFLSFLNSKLAIFKFSTQDEDLNDQLNKIFDCSPTTKLSNDIYNEFVQNNKYYLLGLDSDLDRYIYLENTYRDILVVQRLLDINRKISALTDNHSKNVVYYLSSASFKSRKIMECASVQNSLPCFSEFERFNFHRNILQVFLFKVLKVEYGGSNRYSEEPLIVLDSIKSLLRNYHSRKETNRALSSGDMAITSVDNFIYRRIMDMLDKHLLSQIGNQLYYRIYKQKKKTLQDVIKLGKYAEIQKLLNEIDVVLAKESHLMRSIDLQTKKYSNTATFIESIKSTALFNPIGDDPIKNPFHHLPTLLFIDTEYQSVVSNDFYKLLNILTETPVCDDLEEAQYLPLLDSILLGVSQQKRSLSSINFDLIATNFFLLISKPSLLSYESENDSVIDNLEKHKSRLYTSLQSARYDGGQTAIAISQPETNDLTRELDYLLIWLYRRARRYGDAVRLAKTHCNHHDSLGVFHHGLALALIASQIEGPEVIASGDDSISDSEKCTGWVEAGESLQIALDIQIKYYLASKDSMSRDVEMLLIKSIISILNSLANLYIKYHEMGISDKSNPTRDWLADARHILKIEMDNYFKKLHVSFDEFPVFNHTEVELEYYEALRIYEQNSRPSAALALNKVMCATSRAMNFQHSIKSLNSQSFNIIGKVNKLRYEIMKSLNYI